MWILLCSLVYAVPAVAVADLANQTGEARYDPAQGGAASMLVSKLAQIDDIRVVERTQLQAVLREIELSSSGVVDDATRVEAGRVIGADFIVMGTMFSIQPGVLTVNLRVVDTETAEVVRAADVEGRIGPDGSGFFELVDLLVAEVVDGLALELSEAEKIAVTNVRLRELEALLKYGTVAVDTPAAAKHAQALWRDRSRDMMKDTQRRAYAVFTNGGVRVITVRQFAELVNDEAMLEAIKPLSVSSGDRREFKKDQRRRLLLGRRWVGVGYTPEEADRWIESYNRSLLESSPPL